MKRKAARGPAVMEAPVRSVKTHRFGPLLFLGISFALAPVAPAGAQPGDGKSIGALWAAATTHCTETGIICAELAEQTVTATQALLEWGRETAENAAQRREAGKAPLSVTSFQVATAPEDIIQERITDLRRASVVRARALRDLAGSLTGDEDAPVEVLSSLAGSLDKYASVLEETGRTALGAYAQAMPALERLPKRTTASPAFQSYMAEVDNLLERALQYAAFEPGAELPQNELAALRGQLTTLAAKISPLLDTVNWETRLHSVDFNSLLSVQKILAIAEILYSVDLDQFAFRSQNFPKSQYRLFLGQIDSALKVIETQAQYSRQIETVRASHAAMASSLDTILSYYDADPLQGTLSADNSRERRRPQICMSDQAKNFTAYLKTEFTARHAFGLYSLDFDPERSEVRLDGKYDRDCFAASALTTTTINFPAQMPGALLGMNLYLSFQVAQMNWYTAQMGLVRELEALQTDARQRLSVLTKAVEDEPVAVAQRGARLRCEMRSRGTLQGNGTVVFDAEIEPDGGARAVVFRSAIPQGADQDTLENQILRLLRCKSYDGRSIDARPVYTWTTIALEIQS